MDRVGWKNDEVLVALGSRHSPSPGRIHSDDNLRSIHGPAVVARQGAACPSCTRRHTRSRWRFCRSSRRERSNPQPAGLG